MDLNIGLHVAKHNTCEDKCMNYF